jgi:hypothetical protein
MTKSYIYSCFAYCFDVQLHDNKLTSLPGALGELEQLQQLRLRYTHTHAHTFSDH